MATQKKIVTQFFNGLAWNGIALFIQKVATLCFSVSLYKTLPVDQFSAWALANSIVFLLLLWLDFGLKKSIPRYAPRFIKNSNAHRKFVIYTIVFQAFLLVFIGTPTIIFALKSFLRSSLLPLLLLPCIIMFVVEGIASVLRSLYHAHSLQKFFNTTCTIKTLFEIALSYLTLMLFASKESFLISLIINRIIGTTFLIVVSLYHIHALYPSKKTRNEPFNLPYETKGFIRHSLFMWASTFIKSISERNFLFPFLTFTIGPSAANLFKVTHDSSLFFQRMILKTIGVTDTTLLSHAEESKGNIRSIFKILFRTIKMLCIPLPIGALLFYVINNNSMLSIAPLITFLIFVTSYLLEILLSPYERILETKQRYKTLWTNYTPYCIIFALATILMSLGKISVLIYFIIIQTGRLVSSLCNMKSTKLILNKL